MRINFHSVYSDRQQPNFNKSSQALYGSRMCYSAASVLRVGGPDPCAEVGDVVRPWVAHAYSHSHVDVASPIRRKAGIRLMWALLSAGCAPSEKARHSADTIYW